MKKISILLAFIFLLNFNAFSQTNSDEVLRIDTSLVVVPVRVYDTQGKFIPNLTKENFRIFENKVEQEISDFDTDNSPFTLALMLDVSDSTKFKAQEIQDAAIAFLKKLRPQDSAIVFLFNRNLVKIYEGNGENLSKLEESIKLTKPSGGTSLYDAIDTVITDYLEKTTQRKKAIVIFTDGIDTASRANNQKSLLLSQEANASIYSIQYEPTGLKPENTRLDQVSTVMQVTPQGLPISVAYKNGTNYLNQISGNSGGKFYFADSLPNLTKVFTQIAQELAELYVLSYYPKNDDNADKSRQIKVITNLEKAKIKARKTYRIKNQDK